MLQKNVKVNYVEPHSRIEDIPEPTDKLGVYKFLEKIGRTCYKSEDKITDMSAITFCTNIFNRNHWAILEHYIFAFSVSQNIYDSFMNIIRRKINSDDPDANELIELKNKMKYINISHYHNRETNIMTYIISGSATAFNYLAIANDVIKAPYTGPIYMITLMKSMYPEIIVNINTNLNVPDYSLATLLSRDDIASLPDEIRQYHDFMTVEYCTDRAVCMEIVRHRPFSYAMESTRYCNYGKKGYNFIIPEWIAGVERECMIYNAECKFTKPVKIFKKAVQQSANAYDQLLKSNWTPQQARYVLPNGLKASLYQTGRLVEWKHFFEMRVPNSAHPQMREVSRPLLLNAIRKYDTFKYLNALFKDRRGI